MKTQKYSYIILFLLFGILSSSIITIPNLQGITFSINNEFSLKSHSNGGLIRYLEGIQVNEYTSGDQGSSSICPLSDDAVAIIWNGEGSGDNVGIYARIFNTTTGENLTVEFRVNDYTTGSQNNPSACALSNEKFVIAWQGEGVGDADGIWARVFNATTGTSISSMFRVNSYTMGNQHSPSICALSNEIFAISWSGVGASDNIGIYASVFNATTGTNITSEFRVNNYITNNQYLPSICALSNETFVAAWYGEGASDNDGIYARVFNATTGANLTSEFRVNNYIINDQSLPSVCALTNESFVITWQGEGASDNLGIYARVFNATTGTNMTSDIQVNNFVNGFQYAPISCSLSNETFVITWFGAGASDNDGIHARVFDATTGANLTSEFRVNNYTSETQYYPFICALSNETFAITWSGVGAGDDSGVFFSVFALGNVDSLPGNGSNDTPPIDFGLYLLIFIIIILGLAITIIGGSIYSYKKTKYKNTLNQPQIHKKVIKRKEMLPIEGYTEAEKKEIERTESEVNVEKKKLTCVVHRGSIEGAIYTCPECNTFYCLNCAKVLKEKGENCWVCNHVINLK